MDNCQCLPNHFLKNPCTKLERIKHSASSAAPPPTGAILPPRTLVPNLSISVCLKSLGSMMLMLPFENNNQKDFKVKNARAQLHKSLKALSLTLLTLLPKTNIEMHYQRTSIHESLSHFFWRGGGLCLVVCRILVPRPKIEPVPLHRMCTVLTTGPPGKSPPVTFWKRKRAHVLANDVLTFCSSCV